MIRELERREKLAKRRTGLQVYGCPLGMGKGHEIVTTHVHIHKGASTAEGAINNQVDKVTHSNKANQTFFFQLSKRCLQGFVFRMPRQQPSGLCTDAPRQIGLPLSQLNLPTAGISNEPQQAD